MPVTMACPESSVMLLPKQCCFLYHCEGPFSAAPKPRKPPNTWGKRDGGGLSPRQTCMQPSACPSPTHYTKNTTRISIINTNTKRLPGQSQYNTDPKITEYNKTTIISR